MRRRRVVVATVTVVCASLIRSDVAGAVGTTSQSSSGATNTGSSVNVYASETQTTPGGGGPGGGGGQGRSGPDYDAIYRELAGQMAREGAIEQLRRTNEHRALGEAQARYERCSAAADHYYAAAFERVLVVEWVPREVRIPVPRPVRMREVHWHRIRVFRHWIAWPHIHEWVTWRTHWITVTVWERREHWETRVNPIHLLQSYAFRICANNAAADVNRLRREITERRDAWDRMWSSLNARTHEAWRASQTRCTTVREVGDTDVQRCSYPEWRERPAQVWERTIAVPPARPPEQVVRQAQDLLRPDSPLIRMSPRVEWEQIVRLPTWLWIDASAWEAETARAQAGRAWAEAKATPARVIWNMGNGDTVTCAGPGTPFDESRPEAQQRTGCTYTYRRSSAGQPNDAYAVTATLVYDVTWSGAADSGGSLGTLTTTASVPVRVAEIQAIVR